MKAVVFSIGEPTTDLCVWSVERQGFEVELLYDPYTTLAQKLKFVLDNFDENILRVDADIICNENIKYFNPNRVRDPYEQQAEFKDIWWFQSKCFDWYKQSIEPCSVGVITQKAIRTARGHIDKYMHDSRPETRLWRLDEFHNPRRCMIMNDVIGIHGYKQVDLDRIKLQKAERNQNYDWPLIEAINAL